MVSCKFNSRGRCHFSEGRRRTCLHPSADTHVTGSDHNVHKPKCILTYEISNEFNCVMEVHTTHTRNRSPTAHSEAAAISPVQTTS